jgi:hypothetical protein
MDKEIAECGTTLEEGVRKEKLKTKRAEALARHSSEIAQNLPANFITTPICIALAALAFGSPI